LVCFDAQSFYCYNNTTCAIEIIVYIANKYFLSLIFQMRTFCTQMIFVCWCLIDMFVGGASAEPAKKLCGKTLSDMMERVCSGGYYGPGIRKRSGTYSTDWVIY
jgi:hypothetical protein